MTYQFGVVAGLIFFLILTLVLVRKKGQSHSKYDEMQTAIRGTAYQYATVTGVLAGIILGLLLDMDAFPMDGSFSLMVVSFLMVTIYIVYMVMKGVYFGISGNWKKWTLLIFIIGLSNLIIGTLHITREGLPEGRLTIVNSNLMMGISFLIIVAAVMIRKERENRSEY